MNDRSSTRPRPSPLTLTALGLGIAALLGLTLAPRRIPAAHGHGKPPGRPKRPMTRALEAGATLLQGTWPLDEFDVYLVGFHPVKEHPEHQMEAHHFCRQVNEDFMECALFDGNTRDANLIGIEYIISERLFETLPQDERPFWHPHNAEILSGQLTAPGIPAPAEHALMAGKINSYGKTWHVWHTGTDEEPGDPLPVGEPKLMWSFNRLGEARQELIDRRDRRFGVDTETIRRRRADLAGIAHPQEGVDALKGRFPRPTREIPGVRDKKERVTP